MVLIERNTILLYWLKFLIYECFHQILLILIFLLYSSFKLMVFLLVVYLAIGVFLALNFDQYFIKFHELFFDNDLWLLDPKTDMMINMLPIGFFISMAKTIFIKAILSLILVMGLIVANEKILRSKRKGCIECSIQEAQ